MRKKTPVLKPNEVTLREIEDANPCAGEYKAFLLAVKSNPVNEHRLADFKRFRSPQFKADDPIPFAFILKLRKHQGYMSGADRLAWLANRIYRIAQAAETAHNRATIGLRQELEILNKRCAEIETEMESVPSGWRALMPVE